MLQRTAYYPSGVPLTPNELTPQTIKLHTGKDFFDLQGAGWYDTQALKATPHNFEALRNNYNYRNEVK